MEASPEDNEAKAAAVVGVEAAYSFNGGDVVHRFSSAGQEQQAVELEKDPYGYRYTGRHDNGLLPTLKQGGVYGQLLQALLDAKEENNVYMTKIVEAERERAAAAGDGKKEVGQGNKGKGGGGGQKQQKQNNKKNNKEKGNMKSGGKTNHGRNSQVERESDDGLIYEKREPDVEVENDEVEEDVDIEMEDTNGRDDDNDNGDGHSSQMVEEKGGDDVVGDAGGAGGGDGVGGDSGGGEEDDVECFGQLPMKRLRP